MDDDHTPATKIKARQKGEGRSTAELFTDARSLLRSLEKQMDKRRNRDRASTLLTDAYVALQEIGQRLAKTGPEFDSRPPAQEDEDEQMEFEVGTGVSLAHVMVPNSVEERELEILMRKRVQSFRAEYETIERVRLIHLRQLMDFLCTGCRQVGDVTRKVVAIARRVRPELLKDLGMSQVEVSRKFGEKRATTSAREKRVVEGTLKKNGTKGFQLLGGVKSVSHRENCRRAQMGNTNRADAEKRRRAAKPDFETEDLEEIAETRRSQAAAQRRQKPVKTRRQLKRAVLGFVAGLGTPQAE